MINPIALYKSAAKIAGVQAIGECLVVRSSVQAGSNPYDPTNTTQWTEIWRGETIAVKLVPQDEFEERLNVGEVKKQYAYATLQQAGDIREGDAAYLKRGDFFVCGRIARVNKRLVSASIYVALNDLQIPDRSEVGF